MVKEKKLVKLKMTRALMSRKSQPKGDECRAHILLAVYVKVSK